jgi:hypothetical protein
MPKRIELCAMSSPTPIARSTWLGSRLADVQAEPEDTARSLMPMISDSPSTYAKDRFELFGSGARGRRSAARGRARRRCASRGVAQLAVRRAFSRISARQLARLAEPDDARDVERARAHAALVPAAVHLRHEAHARVLRRT